MDDIKSLEKIVERCEDCKFAACENCEINWTEVQLIKKIIKENKELKEENNRIKSLDYTTLAEEMEMGLWMPRADVEEYYIPIENLNDYIPKSKVKEKIEVLKMKADYDWVYKYDYKDVIKILQELLEEGE